MSDRQQWTPPSVARSKEILDLHWWTLSGQEASGSVTSVLESIRMQQSQRNRQLALSALLYGNRPVFQMYGGHQLRMIRSSAVPLGRLTFNVIQSAVDTLVSKITQDESVPYYLTSGGDFKQRRKAKLLTKFSDGILYENDAQILGAEVLRDALILGDGYVYGYKESGDDDDDYGRVCFERVLATEIYIDDLDGQYGCPRSMHRVKNVDKRVLMGMMKDLPRWDSNKKAIESCPLVPLDGVATDNQTAQCVEVRESWHLPSMVGATDGCHKLTIDNAELFTEKYNKDYFPFVRLPWCPPVAGFHSISAAAQLQGIQLELNKLLWLQSRSIHLAGSFHWWVPIGSQVVREHVNNAIGRVSYYTGATPPMSGNVQPVHEQIVVRIQQLKQDAFEQLGVSMMEAQAKKPAGLSSGEALKTYADINSERFYAAGKKYQRFMMELSKLGLRLAQEIANDDGGYSVKRPTTARGGSVEELEWEQLGDLDLDDDCYVQKCFSISLTPQTPAGIQQTIADRLQAGWLTPRQARRLQDYPDLAAADALFNASEEYLAKILDKMLDGDSENPMDDYTAPDPEDDMQSAAEMVVEYIQEAKLNDAPEERINLLRTFKTQLDELTQAAAPPPGTPGAPGGAPGATAVPQAPPTSDLLPMQGAPTPGGP